MFFQEECLDQINGVLLTNLNWLKGLKAWNKVFKFFENEQDLLDVVKIGKTPKKSYESSEPQHPVVEGWELCHHNFSYHNVGILGYINNCTHRQLYSGTLLRLTHLRSYKAKHSFRMYL